MRHNVMRVGVRPCHTGEKPERLATCIGFATIGTGGGLEPAAGDLFGSPTQVVPDGHATPDL